ncbi:MAG: VCBS repeat-containing protein [Nitrospirota bacterium]|nr:VCBS repeat-containing protein [Nitrospirota bacterium]
MPTPSSRMVFRVLLAVLLTGWSAPASADHGCGYDRPRECSIPAAAEIIAPHQAFARHVFRDACREHDNCYRHGYVTYGDTRLDCDQEFLHDMIRHCENPDTITMVVNLPVGEGIEIDCQGWARQMYSAVRKLGMFAFHEGDADYCEYRGRGLGTPNMFRYSGWHVGDFNGDGMDDLMRQSSGKGGADVLLSNSLEFLPPQTWTSAKNRGQGWYVADFDADGRDDLFRHAGKHGGVEVLTSSGKRFENPSPWTETGDRGRGYIVGDFNGDRRGDLLRYATPAGGTQVMLAGDSGLLPYATWTTAEDGGLGFFVGDFNGDHRADLFRYMGPNRQVVVMVSRGDDFSAPRIWQKKPGELHGWLRVGDFNGDGKDDLLKDGSHEGGAWVMLSHGGGFEKPRRWSTQGHGGHGWYTGDFNGDGKTDLLRYHDDTGGADVLASTGKAFADPVVWTMEPVHP